MAVVHCSQQPPQPGVRRRPAVDTAAASTVRQLLWELASGGPTSRSTRHGGGWALRKRPPGVLREAEGRGRATDRARPARRRGSAQTHRYGAHATAATFLYSIIIWISILIFHLCLTNIVQRCTLRRFLPKASPDPFIEGWKPSYISSLIITAQRDGHRSFRPVRMSCRPSTGSTMAEQQFDPIEPLLARCSATSRDGRTG